MRGVPVAAPHQGLGARFEAIFGARRNFLNFVCPVAAIKHAKPEKVNYVSPGTVCLLRNRHPRARRDLNRFAKQGFPVRSADDVFVSFLPDRTIEGCQDTFHIVVRA